MSEYLQRRAHMQPVTIANGAAVSGAFDMGLYTMGLVIMPATWTAAHLGFKVCATEGGTFVPLYDHDNALVQVDLPVASKAYDLPPEVCAARYVKLWSQDGSATDTNQEDVRTLTLLLKA